MMNGVNLILAILLTTTCSTKGGELDDLIGQNIWLEQAEFASKYAKGGTPPYERLLKLYEEDPRLAYAKENGLKPLPDEMFGFYLHVHKDPAAVIHMVDRLNTIFPNSPIYIMSDGGHSYVSLCELYGCTFVECPSANDRWNPWPFLRRIWDAAVSLKTEYIIMLEPDNTIHRKIYIHPDHDAGGMLDANPHFHYELVEWIERMGKTHRPNFSWNWTGSGLAGGAYFRTAAVIDAFSDAAVAKLNWTQIESFESARAFSSDFAMPIVLGAKGYTYGPWAELTQYDLRGDPAIKIYTQQPLEAAFAHYGRGVEGGKPTYNFKITKSLARLYKEGKYSQGNVAPRTYKFQDYYERYGSHVCTNRLAAGNTGKPTDEQRKAVIAELAETFGGKYNFHQQMLSRFPRERAFAEEMQKKALEIKLKMYGPDHIDDFT